MDSRIYSAWYVQPNDVTGGWCIMDVDDTPGNSGRPEIADFCEKEAAEHIVWLHNRWTEKLGG